MTEDLIKVVRWINRKIRVWLPERINYIPAHLRKRKQVQINGCVIQVKFVNWLPMRLFQWQRGQLISKWQHHFYLAALWVITLWKLHQKYHFGRHQLPSHGISSIFQRRFSDVVRKREGSGQSLATFLFSHYHIETWLSYGGGGENLSNFW